MKNKSLLFLLFLPLFPTTALAKDPPAQVIVWPDTGSQILRFSFANFHQTGGSGSQRYYVSDTEAANLWGKRIPEASFSVYFFDKDKVRIGQGYISLRDVRAGEIVKFQTTVQTTGVPVSLSWRRNLFPPSYNNICQRN